MKKILSAFSLVLAFAFLLSACSSAGENGESGADASAAQPSSSAAEGGESASEKPAASDSSTDKETFSDPDAGKDPGASEGGEEEPQSGDETDPSAVSFAEEYENSFDIGGGVRVLELFPYSGNYVEDGSNEKVKNIAAVRIINTSSTAYQLLDFEVETSGEKFHFRATTLFPGAKLTALDLERSAFSDGKVIGGRVALEVGFDQLPSVRADELKVSYTDGFINATNISGKKLEDVYVYYKTMDDFGWFGGITYRALMGSIDDGKTVQVRTENISADSSRVVFITSSN